MRELYFAIKIPSQFPLLLCVFEIILLLSLYETNLFRIMYKVDSDAVKEALLDALRSEDSRYSYAINDDCYLKYLEGKDFYETGFQLFCTKDGKTETEEYPFSYFIDYLVDVFTDGDVILLNMCKEIQDYIEDYFK